MTDFNAPLMTDAHAATSPDGETILLAITDVNNRKLVVRLKDGDLGKMVTFLLAAAEDAAARQRNPQPDQRPVPVKPLVADYIGVGRGRSESEAVLGVRVGPMTLSFVVPLATLLATCSDLRLLTKKESDRVTRH